MKDILKKAAVLLAVSLVLVCVCAGCGNADSVETKKEVTQTGGQENEHEPLTIVSYNSLIKEDFIESFMKIHPEVKLEVISYAGTNGSGYAQYSLERGDIPDIYVATQTFAKEAQAEYLLDMSNYDFVNHYSNALLDSVDMDGAIYLLPFAYQLTGIYYNKTIMEENGWDVPQSFEELEALSPQIEAAGYKTMGNAMGLDGYPFNFFFNIGNTKYFGTPEGTEWKEEFPKGEAAAVGNEQLRETAAYFQRWVDNGFVSAESMDVQQFYEGECVFYLCLGLNAYEYTTESGTTYEFGTIPWLSEDGSNNMLTRTVSRYMGINKKLTEEGNEEKLEDALKLMDYVSTTEGQSSLMAEGSYYVLSLNDNNVPEDSPYQEILGLVEEGRTVPLLYVGWEDQIIPIAQDIKRLIAGECTVDEMLEAFDATNKGLLEGNSDDVYATTTETLSLEDTAKLVAVAEGKAVDADCAMVSLNEYHGNDNNNPNGVAWYLYDGNLDKQMINMFRPRANAISVLELTGTEIKAMRDAGFDANANGMPYEYRLFTKGDIELEDTVTYRLAISTGEVPQEYVEKAVEAEQSPADAIIDYVKALGTVTADVIVWE